MRHLLLPLLALPLAACQAGGEGGANVPGDTSSNAPFQGISADELLEFTGTEPFWGGKVQGTTLTYSTPENIEGETIEVERFAGRGGIAFSGELGGEAFDMVVSDGACSDGMSDRSYPFTVTLNLGSEIRNGCAWSEQHPFSGPEHP